MEEREDGFKLLSNPKFLMFRAFNPKFEGSKASEVRKYVKSNVEVEVEEREEGFSTIKAILKDKSSK